MPMRTKILVAGLITAFVVQAVGWPIASRLGWKANQTQQLCEAMIREKADAIAKGPHATGDTIADATLGRMAALNTPQCQAASATVRVSTRVMYWVSHSAVLLILVSAMPWLYFIVPFSSPPPPSLMKSIIPILGMHMQPPKMLSSMFRRCRPPIRESNLPDTPKRHLMP